MKQAAILSDRLIAHDGSSERCFCFAQARFLACLGQNAFVAEQASILIVCIPC